MGCLLVCLFADEFSWVTICGEKRCQPQETHLLLLYNFNLKKYYLQSNLQLTFRHILFQHQFHHQCQLSLQVLPYSAMPSSSLLATILTDVLQSLIVEAQISFLSVLSLYFRYIATPYSHIINIMEAPNPVPHYFTFSSFYLVFCPFS